MHTGMLVQEHLCCQLDGNNLHGCSVYAVHSQSLQRISDLWCTSHTQVQIMQPTLLYLLSSLVLSVLYNIDTVLMGSIALFTFRVVYTHTHTKNTHKTNSVVVSVGLMISHRNVDDCCMWITGSTTYCYSVWEQLDEHQEYSPMIGFHDEFISELGS